MEQEHPHTFGPFHFDGSQGRLWQGDQSIALRPQSLAPPRYLVAHHGRLVTKAELRQHVWAGTASGKLHARSWSRSTSLPRCPSSLEQGALHELREDRSDQDLHVPLLAVLRM